MVIDDYIPWLKDVAPMFKRQMIYRLNNSEMTLSMSGLANHIQIKSSMGLVFYRACIEKEQLDIY